MDMMSLPMELCLKILSMCVIVLSGIIFAGLGFYLMRRRAELAELAHEHAFVDPATKAKVEEHLYGMHEYVNWVAAHFKNNPGEYGNAIERRRYRKFLRSFIIDRHLYTERLCKEFHITLDPVRTSRVPEVEPDIRQIMKRLYTTVTVNETGGFAH